MVNAIKQILPESVKHRIRLVAHRLRRWGYPYVCPVCGVKVAEFMPLPPFFIERYGQFGFDYRNRIIETLNIDSYACPSCGASDRDRLYALYLRGHLPQSEQGSSFRLLDIAPTDALSVHIKRVYSVSYRTADLKRQEVDDHVDITDMSIYPSHSFDAFICSHVLEHVQDDMRAMTELYRILKPGGWGIAMVPIEVGLDGVSEDPAMVTEAERWKHFGQGDHVRMYSRRGFVDRLQHAGFEVAILGWKCFGADRFRRCGISMGSVLYISSKPMKPVPVG